MDVNDLRIAVTLIGLVLFLVLVAHTWSRRRLAEHTDAALLPFLGGDDAPAAPATDPQGRPQGRTQGDKS